jgi:hypothetical protein
VSDGPFVHWFAYISYRYISPRESSGPLKCTMNSLTPAQLVKISVSILISIKAVHPGNQRAHHLSLSRRATNKLSNVSTRT